MNAPSLDPRFVVDMRSISNEPDIDQTKEVQMNNVVAFHPTALATVVGLPFAYGAGEHGRWQAMLRLRRYVGELEPLEETVIVQLSGCTGRTSRSARWRAGCG
jgi:hypothetical protein